MTDILQSAQTAVEYAQSVRKYHARRTKRGSKQRATDIEVALDRLKAAMKPIHVARAKAPYGPQTDAAHARQASLREASAALQAERRKLWKMR